MRLPKLVNGVRILFEFSVGGAGTVTDKEGSCHPRPRLCCSSESAHPSLVALMLDFTAYVSGLAPGEASQMETQPSSGSHRAVGRQSSKWAPQNYAVTLREESIPAEAEEHQQGFPCKRQRLCCSHMLGNRR